MKFFVFFYLRSKLLNYKLFIKNMQKIPRMKKILLKLYNVTNFENQSKK